MSGAGKTAASGPPASPGPRGTAELIGHPGAEATLLRAWRGGRLPPAWLLTGPRGVGKATLAYRFARFVLSQGGPGGPAEALFAPPAPEDLAIDPASGVFRRVAAGAHRDLVTVVRSRDPKSKRLRTEIVVEDVNHAIEVLHRTAAEGGWRVVIVDPAEDMNPTVANRLLKILEEPPPRALLMLISHAPGRLLATLRSRCCRLHLRALEEGAAAALIRRRRPDIAAADAIALARLADGSPGRALDLAEDGLEIYRCMIEVLNGLPRLDRRRLFALADRFSASGAEPLYRIARELWTWWLARLIRTLGGAGAAAEVVPGEAALAARLRARLSPTHDLAQWLGLWDKVTLLFDRAERANLDRRQVIVSVFLDLEALIA